MILIISMISMVYLSNAWYFRSPEKEFTEQSHELVTLKYSRLYKLNENLKNCKEYNKTILKSHKNLIQNACFVPVRICKFISKFK